MAFKTFSFGGMLAVFFDKLQEGMALLTRNVTFQIVVVLIVWYSRAVKGRCAPENKKNEKEKQYEECT